MANYLLDTNILSYWYNPNCDEHAKVLARIQAVRQPDPETGYVPRLHVSVVTIGEIQYGHKANPAMGLSKQSEYMEFLREECPEPYPITEYVGENYGELKAWVLMNCAPREMRTKPTRLNQLVNPISGEELGAQENDLWIAAQAMTLGLVLVTHDSKHHFGKLLRHFKSTLQIDVEDWVR